jgi:7-carboxy-7-deazaguanine synthase
MTLDTRDLKNHFGEILFSPSASELPARALADWIVKDRLPVRMQVQLHKALWGDQPGV